MKRATTTVSLPADRAFVVQLAAEAKPERGEVRGRVEHVVSMKATHFHSIEGLMNFIAQVLTALEADDEADDPE